eukprot:4566962-Pleurochrysis_carterae.AAC.3
MAQSEPSLYVLEAVATGCSAYASHGLIESLAVALLVHAALDARHLALADAEALQATNRPLLVARAAAASARTIRRGKRVQRRHADRLGQPVHDHHKARVGTYLEA